MGGLIIGGLVIGFTVLTAVARSRQGEESTEFLAGGIFIGVCIAAFVN